jgi:hypothetical protein
MTVPYKVFRGELEPVTSLRKAEIKFYKDKYLEIIHDYTFQGHGDIYPTDRTEAILLTKESISVWLHTAYHDDDAEKIANPKISIYSYGEFLVNLHIETMDEATEIYTKIKNWLIG